MRSVRLTRVAGMLLVFAVGMAWGNEGDTSSDDRPAIRNFSLPDYNEKMELVSKIEGDEAKVLDKGKFDITNLRFQMYKNGKVDARVTSPTCTFSKKKNQGWSKSPIRITRGDLVVTGEDYIFDGKKERIRIKKNAKVVIRSVNIKLWGDGHE